MSGELHVTAVLPSTGGKELSAPIYSDVGWTPEPVRTMRDKETFLALAGDRTTIRPFIARDIPLWYINNNKTVITVIQSYFVIILLLRVSGFVESHHEAT